VLNIYGDPSVDVGTVGWWVVHFSSDDSGSNLLVQIFLSAACRLLFIADENARLMMVAMLNYRVL